MLVCAPSNSACDEIAERLVKILDTKEIFRMYAKAYHQMLSENIKPISNQKGDEYKFPSLEHLYQYSAVICTLHTAGCLTRARGLDENFSSSHFSHVFIDEAASVQMSVAIIAIAGMQLAIINAFS